jgi:hypothetical protein
VHGVRIGDSLEKCRKTWGEPNAWKKRGNSTDYSIAIWHKKKHSFEVEIWQVDGSEKAFGEYRKNTVKQIVLKKRR